MMIYFLYHLRSNVSSECITIQIEHRYLLPQIGVTLFGLIFNTLLANIISRHGWLFWLNSCIMILHYLKFTSSGATALQGFGRQSGRRLSVKLVPTFADRGVSRGQRNGSPRLLISVYRTCFATYFIQVAPQLTSRG